MKPPFNYFGGKQRVADRIAALLQCPGCGRWMEDCDGFGVLYDPQCGYCEHADRNGGVCTFCGDVRANPPTDKGPR